jgi:hypothetical protein
LDQRQQALGLLGSTSLDQQVLQVRQDQLVLQAQWQALQEQPVLLEPQVQQVQSQVLQEQLVLLVPLVELVQQEQQVQLARQDQQV